MRIKQKYIIDFSKSVTWITVLGLICYFNQTMSWKGHDFDLRDFWTGDLYRPCNDLIQFEHIVEEICYMY